jgi:hypothetical protein
MDRDPVRSRWTPACARSTPADRGPRPAHRPVRGHRRGQERAAGHDGALHPGRRDRGRADRRAGPRGQGVHRGHPGRRRAWRAVVVAAPADAPPLVRMQGANYATAIAEHFRDQGRHVLLLMDSLTRYAMAQREIALAIGEPPATKGYPPSLLRQAAAAGGAQRQRLNGVGPSPPSTPCCQRGRRPAGPDRRCGTRHPGRPHRAVARTGRERPLPGHRHRALRSLA